MSNPLSRQRKVGAILVLFSVAFIFITVNQFSYTNYARNTFFYADYFVADYILREGVIPSVDQLGVPNRWGKIGTLVKTPILPLHLSIVKLITSLPISIIYTAFPSFLLISSGLYIIMSRMGLPEIPASIISLSGGLSVPTTAYYSIAVSATSLGILFLGLATINLHVSDSYRSGIKKRSTLPSGILLSLFLIYLFYRYPPNFVILTAVISVSAVILYFQGIRMPFSLSLLTLSVLIGLQIFSLPLNSYLRTIQTLTVNLLTLDFINPVNAYSSTSSTGYTPKYYSLIPLPALFPLALIGGYYTLRDSIYKTDESSLLAVCWGISALVISVIYMITSEGWLTGRAYFFALPVMFLGAGRFLIGRDWPENVSLAGTILGLVLVSIVLQASLPAVAIHTYEPGIKESSQWASNHVDGTISTDHKLGAAMAANGEFSGKYPREGEFQKVDEIFYSSNYELFKHSVQDYALLSKGMANYGFRAAETLNKPITSRALQMRTTNSNLIYSNGNAFMVQPSS